MCPVCARQVPLLRGKRVLDGAKPHDLLEEIPPIVAVGVVWEIRDRRVPSRKQSVGEHHLGEVEAHGQERTVTKAMPMIIAAFTRKAISQAVSRPPPRTPSHIWK